MTTDLMQLRKAQPAELARLFQIDDEACILYEKAGLHFEFGDDHPFVIDESKRWEASVHNGRAYVVADANDQAFGFCSLCFIDGAPYLDQLSVHPDHMRKGIGTRLLKQAIVWSGHETLWLTTYSHLAWNKPFYEKHAFRVVPESQCGPELKAILDSQRSALPAPEKRVAMALIKRTNKPLL
jgi:GNAT superfamily N-acetyltransferase